MANDRQGGKTCKLTAINLGKSHEFEVPEGCNLLSALQDNKIYLPAICNGRGTCGKCRVKVNAGEFEATKEDKALFSPEQLAQGYRLACTARVAGDSEIMILGADENKFEIISSYIPMGDEITVDSGLNIVRLPLEKMGLSVSMCIHKELGVKEIPIQLLQKLSGCINQGELTTEYEGCIDVLIAENGMRMLDFFEKDKAEVYGIAIDIGTTTIGFELLNMLTGERIMTHSLINRQRKYGADVVTRIVATTEGKLGELQKSIQQDLMRGIGQTCTQAGISSEQVYKVMIAGNTTMIHLLLGIPCNSMGLFPFPATMTSMNDVPFTEMFPEGGGLVAGTCRAGVLPSVTTYVGADITAGIVFSVNKEAKGRSVLIDIGTNGEMALFDGDTGKNVICTSTAAGPAFEGGNISCGTGSVPGAISKVRYNDGKFEFDTIGDQAPVGMCGSGVMDLVACFIKNEMMDETGVYDDEYFEEGVRLAEGITFTQKDVRELQLAKAAIRAGLEIMLEHGKLSYDDVDHLYLAGGFGYRMDINSAVTLGLIPEELQSKIVSIGNSSLGGCVKALLNKGFLAKVVDVAETAEEIALNTDPKFNEYFMDYMYFGDSN